jgi:hypothetical protein
MQTGQRFGPQAKNMMMPGQNQNVFAAQNQKVIGKGAVMDEGPSASVSISDNAGGSIPANSSIQSSIRHH